MPLGTLSSCVKVTWGSYPDSHVSKYSDFVEELHCTVRSSTLTLLLGKKCINKTQKQHMISCLLCFKILFFNADVELEEAIRRSLEEM